MTPVEQAFTDLVHAQKKDPQWVVAETIPVGTTFLAGPPKVSHKSTISLVIAALCARWKCGCLPPWMTCTMGGPSMLFSYEADAGEVRSIMEDGLNVEVEKGAVWIASDPWQFQLDQPGAVDNLVQYLDAKLPRLIVMDPFRNMWSGDENDSGAIIQTLGPLQRWSKDHEAALIIVHHVNKPPREANSGDPGAMFSMRGSSAIPGLADGIIVIEPTRHEGQITFHTKYKRGPSWKRTIQLGVPGYGWPSNGYEVVGEAAHAVREAWVTHRGQSHGIDWLANTAMNMKQSTQGIQQQLRTLERNQMIVMTPQEHRAIMAHREPGENP